MWEAIAIFSHLNVQPGKRADFSQLVDALNYGILGALPPPYRHGKEVCQGC